VYWAITFEENFVELGKKSSEKVKQLYGVAYYAMQTC